MSRSHVTIPWLGRRSKVELLKVKRTAAAAPAAAPPAPPAPAAPPAAPAAASGGAAALAAAAAARAPFISSPDYGGALGGYVFQVGRPGGSER